MLDRLASVRMAVGASALARTPLVRSSSATARMRTITLLLEAAYAHMRDTFAPGSAAADEKYTMDPRAARNMGRNARVARYAVATLIDNRVCHTSSVLSATGPLMAKPPAMLTSASTRGGEPAVCATSRASFATCDSSDRSHANETASCPAA